MPEIRADITIFIDDEPMELQDAIDLYKDLEKALVKAGVDLEKVHANDN